MTAALERSRQLLRRTLADQVAAAFLALQNYQQPERFVRPAVSWVRGAQIVLAEAVAAAAAQHAMSASGTRLSPPIVPRGTVTDVRGLDPFEVYHRPFAVLWSLLGQGAWFREARDRAAQRARDLVDGDLQLAYGHAWRESLQRLPEQSRPRYWRRVTQGEYTCGLCLIAATNRYSRGDLNPMHPGCDCAVRPVFGTDSFDEKAALARAHQAMADIFGESNRRGRDYNTALIRQHGELGPMLVDPNDTFTGPADIAA